MEIKPIKEKNEILYPTIKELPQRSFLKDLMLSATITAVDTPVILYIAVPCYVATPSFMVPIGICSMIRIISAFVAIVSSILLFFNKVKIKKAEKEASSVESLKKKLKKKWWLIGISIIIIIITSLLIGWLENLRNPGW